MKLLTKIVCVLYSAYCNFRLFPFRVAIKLPLQVHYKTKISACKNSIIIEGEVQRFMVKLGFGGSEGIMGKSGSNLLIKQGGTLKIREGILIAPGCSIRIERNALLCLGKNFSMNKNGFIYCADHINIGNDVLIGWNVNIRDNDGHTIYYDDGHRNTMRPVNIGNHVWIAADSSILKCSLGDNIVVASNTVVYKSFFNSNILIGGQPVKVLKENIQWRI